MTPNLDVADVQRALDALVVGDQIAATEQFTDDVELIGTGGRLDGRARGLPAVLARFAEVSELTAGTFGTEVEAVYRGNCELLVVVTRHWAQVDGIHVHGTQALVVTSDGTRIRGMNVLSSGGPPSRIWD